MDSSHFQSPVTEEECWRLAERLRRLGGVRGGKTAHLLTHTAALERELTDYFAGELRARSVRRQLAHMLGPKPVAAAALRGLL